MGETAAAETERLFQFYKRRNSEKQEGADGSGACAITEAPTVWRSREEAATYVRDNIDTILFDCDGVLYRTTSLCPGASECIRGLLEMEEKRVLFVTNNAGVNRRELREKLSRLLCIDSLTKDQMISSAYSSAVYLQDELLKRPLTDRSPRVHVIGSSGLCEELAAAGFNVTGGPSLSSPDEPGSMSREELASYDFDKIHPIDALVVGHDTDLNFRKLCIADNLFVAQPERSLYRHKQGFIRRCGRQ